MELAGYKGYISRRKTPCFYSCDRKLPCYVEVTDTKLKAVFNMSYYQDVDAHHDDILNIPQALIVPGHPPYQCEVSHEGGRTTVTADLKGSASYPQLVSNILSDLVTYPRLFTDLGEKDYGQVLFKEYATDTVTRNGQLYTRYQTTDHAPTDADPELTLYVPTNGDAIELEVRYPGDNIQYRDIEYQARPETIDYKATSRNPDCAIITIHDCSTPYLFENKVDIHDLVSQTIRPTRAKLGILETYAENNTPVTVPDSLQGSSLQAMVKLDLDDLNQAQLEQ